MGAEGGVFGVGTAIIEIEREAADAGLLVGDAVRLGPCRCCPLGRGAGAGAGGGGRSDKKGRGLGGPIAPSIEDDAEFGPRSEGAGAGGRD